MNIFNHFSELKAKCDCKAQMPYNIVNMGGQIVYVEGQKGLLKLSAEEISFKLKTGYGVIKGNNLFIRELTEHTILIQGKIYKVEVF